MLRRPGYYKDGSEGEEVDENEAQVIIAKHRHGETGTVKMYSGRQICPFCHH